MSEEQADQVTKVHDVLVAAVSGWPDGIWNNSDYYAVFLERALARAIGAREILYVSAAIEAESHQDVRRFEATVFTRGLVIAGGINVPPVEPGETLPYPRRADVTVIPRRAIKAVSLHDLNRFGSAAEAGPDVVEFSLTVEGREPIHIKAQSSDRSTGAGSKLLDSIIEDLELAQAEVAS